MIYSSVERVVEYLDLPQEPPNTLAGKEVPASWPSITTVGPAQTLEKPFITVENLIIRYSPELPPVLHGVSFELRAGEKIGLLGRTGSGKSTLAMSLLRFTDPSAGRIIIDGIDICEIGLGDLRSKLVGTFYSRFEYLAHIPIDHHPPRLSPILWDSQVCFCLTH